MGFLGFGGGGDDELRKNGTRVPAALSSIDTPWGNDDASHRTYTMHWVAHSPEGGTIEFDVRAKWCPPEGIYLEAACDEARENATLRRTMQKYGLAANLKTLKQS